MEVLINGQAFKGFISGQVSRSFNNMTGSYSFVSTPYPIGKVFPIQQGDKCQIVVEDTVFLTGFVETIDLAGSLEDGVIATVSGRDTTGDLVDDTIDWNIVTEFTGNLTLLSLCQQVISKLEITDLSVIDNVSPAPFEQGVLIAPVAGMKAMDFLQQYAQLAQTLLNTDGNNHLLISRGVNDLLDARLLLEKEGKTNNILSFASTNTTINQFNKYFAYSQASLAYFEFSGTKFSKGAQQLQNTIVTQTGTSINKNIRKGRKYVFVADTPLSKNQITQDFADWENNYRQTQGFKYQATVRGHTYEDKKIWSPNNTISVKDDLANIDEIMFIDTVDFTEDLTQGKRTTLTLMKPDAYSLVIEQGYRKALANVQQKDYVNIQSTDS